MPSDAFIEMESLHPMLHISNAFDCYLLDRDAIRALVLTFQPNTSHIRSSQRILGPRAIGDPCCSMPSIPTSLVS